jgi:hypothetical protein
MEELEQEDRGGDHDDDWQRERVFMVVEDEPLLVRERARAHT